MNKRKGIQFLILGLFLIGLPAISWYYLKSGFDYQKKSVSELKQLGEVFDINGYLPDGSLWTTQMTKEKLGVMHLLSCEEYSGESLLREKMDLLYRQFEDRQDVMIISFLYGCNPGSDFGAIAGEGHRNEKQEKLRVFVRLEDEQKLLYKQKALEIGSSEQEKDIILFDDNGMIRNIYTSGDEGQFKRLVEHIAILMPREQEDIQLRREREK